MACSNLFCKLPRPCCLVVLAVVAGLAPALPAATLPQPGSGVASAEQELDEVIVRGTPMWRLRQAIVEAEERFYTLYNELNGQDDFDVNCRMEASLGTRIRKRICRVAFFEEAEARFAQSLFTGVEEQDPQAVFLGRRDEYHRHALAVINGDPRLLRLVRQRERLQQELDEEYRKRFRKARKAVE